MNMTADQISTALCLWEAVLQARANDTLNDGLEEHWGNNGAWQLRFECIAMAPYVDKLWDELGDDLQDEVGAFDWEFCPTLIDMMEDLTTLPTVEQIKAHINFIKGL